MESGETFLPDLIVGLKLSYEVHQQLTLEESNQKLLTKLPLITKAKDIWDREKLVHVVRDRVSYFWDCRDTVNGALVGEIEKIRGLFHGLAIAYYMSLLKRQNSSISHILHFKIRRILSI